MSPRRRDFISENRDDFGVKRICRGLGVSGSGYYQHRATADARAERAIEEANGVGDRQIHADHQGAWRPARPCRTPLPREKDQPQAREQTDEDQPHRRTAPAAQEAHDHSGKAAPPVPDLVMRNFTADMLNTKWCGDITYVAVGSTCLIATVIDICSRRVIGWSIADHMRASLVTDAIEMAVAARGGQVHGVVFHPDRGAQYGSAAFAEACRRHGIRRSMGRVGSSYDNALAESFFQGLKARVAARKALDLEGADTAGAVQVTVVLQPAPPPLRPRLPRASRV